MHCFPNFVSLSVCSYSSLNFFKKIILNFFGEFIDVYIFRVSHWSFVSYLLWCYVYLILYGPCICIDICAFE